MTSPASDDSALEGFIIAPTISNSPSPPARTSTGPICRIPDQDSASPPSDRLNSSTQDEMTEQPPTFPHPRSPVQQSISLTDIADQTAALNMEDKDNQAMSTGMVMSDVNPQTAPAKTPSFLTSFAHDASAMNAVKDVIKNDKSVQVGADHTIHAHITIASSSQKNNSGQAAQETNIFTAGSEPISAQSGLGISISTAAGPFAQDAPTQGLQGNTGIPTIPADLYYELQNCPKIKVTFECDSEAHFWVPDLILKEFLGTQACLWQARVSGESVCIEGIQPWTFSFISHCIEGRLLEGDEREVHCAGKSNDKLVGIYLAAVRFGHTWLLPACLQAMDPYVGPNQFIKDFYIVYHKQQATPLFRKYFRRGYCASLLIDAQYEPVKVNPILRLSGKVGEDIATATEEARESEQDIVWSGEKKVRCRCDGIVGGSTELGAKACRCQDSLNFEAGQNDNVLQQKYGWVQTPLHSKTNDGGWGKTPYGSMEEFAKQLEARARAVRDHVQPAFQVMQAVIGGDEDNVPYDRDWGLDGVPGGSERVEAASQSAIANNDWTVNDSWGAPADDQLTEARNIRTWDDTAALEAARSLQHVAGSSGEAAFYPRRQLAPAPILSTPTPAPPRRPVRVANAAATQAPAPGPAVSAMNSTGLNPLAAADSHGPPVGMPNYIHSYGYARTMHVGNGAMHPTSPGAYGLAGSTMVARQNSQPPYSGTLYFQEGDVITNVVSGTASLSPLISYSQGICRGRHGTFPTYFVRPVNSPVYRQLASPFGVATTQENVETAEDEEDWGARADTMQAHVSDDNGADDGDDVAYDDVPNNGIPAIGVPNNGGPDASEWLSQAGPTPSHPAVNNDAMPYHWTMFAGTSADWDAGEDARGSPLGRSDSSSP